MNTRDKLLATYAPNYFFDPTDKFKPCSIKAYAERCELYIGGELVKKAGELTDEILTSKTTDEWRKEFGKTGDIDLKPADDILEGESDCDTIYGRAFDIKIKDSDGQVKEMVALTYVMTYAYDNPTSCFCCCPTDKMAGWHYGDIEHVSVYLAKDKDGNITGIDRMFYAAHGSGEGAWVKGKDIQLEDGTHPVVYVAKGTHASYSQSGTYCRILGWFNDVINLATPEPTSWKPSVKDHKMFDMDINFGFGHVGTFQSYMHQRSDVTERSTTYCMRCCGVICTCCDDPCYESVKNSCMTTDHIVLSSNPITLFQSENIREEKKEEKSVKNSRMNADHIVLSSNPITVSQSENIREDKSMKELVNFSIFSSITPLLAEAPLVKQPTLKI